MAECCSTRSRSPSSRATTPTSPKLSAVDRRKKEHCIVQDIIRLCKERHFTTGREIPPFLEVTAYFQLRAAMLQFPQRKLVGKDYEEMLDLCVHHIAQENCPAQETIRLQVTAQAAAFLELKTVAEESIVKSRVLVDILKDIPEIEVKDMRETFKTVEKLHLRMLDYMIESGRQLDESMGYPEESEYNNQSEISAAFESIFPEANCLFWMDLPKPEKERQVVEMASVIQGIRIYNKYKGKGGTSFHLPYELYKVETRDLLMSVIDLLQKLQVKIHVCSYAITLHLKPLGLHHVIIQRLRDELSYHLQAFALLADLQNFLHERFSVINDLKDKSADNLDSISEEISSQNAIANELVFPKFEAIGCLHRAMLDELQILRAHTRSVIPLLSLAAQPLFQCTPTGICYLCEQSGYAKTYYCDWKNSSIAIAKLNVLIMYTTFLPKDMYTVDWSENDRIGSLSTSIDKKKGIILKGDKVEEALNSGKEIELSGYCPVALGRYRGLLVAGDPEIGLIDVDGKLYASGNADTLEQFGKCPLVFLSAVENVVRKMPQLVHILHLQTTPTFSSLSVSEYIDVLNEAFACEFSTQTATHLIESHRWTEEALYKRVLELKNVATDSTQTERCFFRRSSYTQVWLGKEKWTQTRLNKGTKMSHHVRHMHGLRGAPTAQFKMLHTKYDV